VFIYAASVLIKLMNPSATVRDDTSADLEVTVCSTSSYSFLLVSCAVHIHEHADAEFLEYKCMVKILILVLILTCKHPFIGYFSVLFSFLRLCNIMSSGRIKMNVNNRLIFLAQFQALHA
jgi:hypothetical protein